MLSDEKKANVIVGSTEYLEIDGIKNIPAKIDTGADTSSIWASNINMKKDGTLVFSLFDKKSPFYTGVLLETRDYRAKIVRSSHGDEQIRYRVKLPLTLGGHKLVTTFTLANRSRNQFPVLIGLHTLKGNYLVDVSKSNIKRKTKERSQNLNQEMQIDPYKFHQKYIEKGKS